MPARRDETRRSDDRPRRPGPIGKIGGKYLAAVGSDQHVVIGRVLGEHRNLSLDLNRAAVALAGTAGIGELLREDDLGAKALGGPAERGAPEFIVGVGTLDQKPVSPPLPDKILPKAIRQHRIGRRGVDHIGPAILLAERIVERSGVEDQDTLAFGGIGDLEKGGGGEIGDDELVAAGQKLFGLSNRIGFRRDSNVGQDETLTDKLSGRVVVVDGNLGAGQTAIDRRAVKNGNREPPLLRLI